MINWIKECFSGDLGSEKCDQNRRLNEIYTTGPIFSSQSASLYTEEEPRVVDWVLEKVPTSTHAVNFIQSLFPFRNWILNYNISWFLGDLVAGITIGAVVVPQGMAYALLAGLPPQYGLYTSFMGVLIYWLFATSKDITIGPVAIVSILIGKLVSEAKISHPDIPGPAIASGLTLICGIIISCIGLVRCGWIVGLIPLVSIAAFTTGSAITIVIGQIPSLLGIRDLESQVNTYKTLINVSKHLRDSKLDAAIGLSSLILLYSVRTACNYAIKRYPSQEKRLFFLSTLRTVFVIALFTMISWLVNRNHRSKPLFHILSTVPSGFTAAKIPMINRSIVSIVISQVPVAIIILLLEHIAIAKTFGRVNNYVINPSQEMLAIGVTNILGPFVGGFAATGSFSRSAIKSKAGVRTPLAGVITAVEVLLAIYALPAVFFYIPFSVLSAVIIHSVFDLITPPSTVIQYWRVSPIEVPVFFAGIIMTLFSSIESGIYITISMSFMITVIRSVKAKGRFLGRAKIHLTTGDFIVGDNSSHDISNGNITHGPEPKCLDGTFVRHIFPPLDFSDGTNPKIDVTPPQPGVFIFRFSEGLNYLSASHYLNQFTSYIFANTRRTNQDSYPRPNDRPWNDFKPRNEISDNHIEKPILKAVILDMSAVNHIDVTSMQQLVDARNQLDIYASPRVVNWYFCNINNRWTKRALVASGFGCPTKSAEAPKNSRPIFGIAQVRDVHCTPETMDLSCKVPSLRKNEKTCHEGTPEPKEVLSPSMAMVNGLNQPFFHADLMSAWLSASMDILREQEDVQIYEC